MPNRGGYGAYGASYRGGGGGGDDPLANALSAFHGQWKEQGDRRAEREAQRAAQERAERAQQMEEARFAELQRQAVAQELRFTQERTDRQQDRTDRLRREDEARNEKRGAALLDQGLFAMPSLTGGPGVTMMRGPSKQEREDASAINRQVQVAKLLAGQKAEEELGVLRGRAKALNIGGAETMTAGELAERVAQANDERNHRQRLAEINAQRAGMGTGAAGRPLAQGIADALGSYAGMMGTAETSLDTLDAATDAGKNPTGFIPGLLSGTRPGQWLGIDDDAKEGSARSALTNLASTLMKERSGGAITPQEFVRLEPFLPQIKDDEARARQKLVDLYRELGNIRTARLDALEGAGYNVQGVRSKYTPRENFGRRSALDQLDAMGARP